jgi:hypothetical protein
MYEESTPDFFPRIKLRFLGTRESWEYVPWTLNLTLLIAFSQSGFERNSLAFNSYEKKVLVNKNLLCV